MNRKLQTIKEVVIAIVIVASILVGIGLLSKYVTTYSHAKYRERAGMVLIEGELVYHERTGIVYIESKGGYNNSYVPYLDADGYNCYYNRGTEKIERIE